MKLEEFEQLQDNRFTSLALYGLQTREQLALVLEMSEIRLYWYAKMRKHYYHEFDIYKNGKPRHIEKPLGELRKLQKKIKQIFDKEPRPRYLSAPYKGRSQISNAGAHRIRRQLLTVDIEKFFQNCLETSVYKFFKFDMCCSHEVADTLTKLTCFNGHLPTGASSSPCLAYFVNVLMFDCLYSSEGSSFVRMSLLSDDMTYTDRERDTLDANTIQYINEMLAILGFRLKPSKIRLYQATQPAKVTGVIVMPDGELRMPNRKHLELYQARQAYKTATGKRKKKLKQKIMGLENYRDNIRKSNAVYRAKMRRNGNTR